MVSREPQNTDVRRESGQAALLMLGVLAAVLAGTLVLFGFGQALGARGHAQRAADLAAVSAAQVMRQNFTRLFEPAVLDGAVPNPRHLSSAAYVALARDAALRGARRNGIEQRRVAVAFDESRFAPTRVTVAVRGEVDLSFPDDRRHSIEVRAKATAEIAADADALGMPTQASGGGYSGPLAYRQGKPMRPDVAAAFDRLVEAASADGVALTINSAYRSDAEQQRLWEQHPDPTWVAPPGTSLHRCGTELDLGPPGAYGWLAANASRFHFVQRYAWERWHFGFTLNAHSAPPARPDGAGGSTLPAFVPAAYAPALASAAQRWNVSATLLAAQLYAESNFNPFAVSGAGALGIAQFMPGTAAAIGLRDPFDAEQAIDAQAHLMRDLLRQFPAIPLALAAYNAGPNAVAACGCVPANGESPGYVARILGLMSGAGVGAGTGLT